VDTGEHKELVAILSTDDRPVNQVLTSGQDYGVVRTWGVKHALFHDRNEYYPELQIRPSIAEA